MRRDSIDITGTGPHVIVAAVAGGVTNVSGASVRALVVEA